MRYLYTCLGRNPGRGQRCRPHRPLWYQSHRAEGAAPRNRPPLRGRRPLSCCCGGRVLWERVCIYVLTCVCVCVCVCVRVCVCVCWSVKSFSINRTAQHTRSSQDQHFPSLLPTQSTISPSCTTHISAFLHKVVCLPMALPLHTTDLGLLTLPTKPANAQMLQQRKWTSDIPAVP